MNCTTKLFFSSIRSFSKCVNQNNIRIIPRFASSELRINAISLCPIVNWSKYVGKLNVTSICGFHSTNDALQADAFLPSSNKKRSLRKKITEEHLKSDKFNVFALATADEYDLESLHDAIKMDNLYDIRTFYTNADTDVLYVRVKANPDVEPSDIFYFREGSVVFWNCNNQEMLNVLHSLEKFEISSYDRKDVLNELEFMNYNYVSEGQKSLLKNGDFYIERNDDGALAKYTFSNAMTSSVKLGIWELFLDKYVDSLEFVTTDLKEGRKIKLSRAKALKKTGELFSLKHTINLSSNLLETPDFYWDREQLEVLFLKTCSYFAVQKRKTVINEKLNHCLEITELISSHLNDKHHIRLEWLIIILITVEVAFEFYHYYQSHSMHGHVDEAEEK